MGLQVHIHGPIWIPMPWPFPPIWWPFPCGPVHDPGCALLGPEVACIPFGFVFVCIHIAPVQWNGILEAVNEGKRGLILDEDSTKSKKSG